MKSPYYVATVVNAYRRAIDLFKSGNDFDKSLLVELEKTSHRRYTTGFYFGSKDKEYLLDSMPIQSYEFMAIVKESSKDGYVTIEQRNRFELGEELEVLSSSDNHNKVILVEEMVDEDGNSVAIANRVQQVLRLKTDLDLSEGDILRKRIDK